MPNPRGINQYTKGGSGGGSKKPAKRGGKTEKAKLKESYQKATKSARTATNLARANSLPGMNSDYGSRAMATNRANQATAKAASLKAAYRKAR